MSDIRFARRAFSKTPGFTIVVVLTLALGVGATTAIFSVANAVLLEPLPFANADRLVVSRVSIPDYKDLKASVTVLRRTRGRLPTGVHRTRARGAGSRIGDARLDGAPWRTGLGFAIDIPRSALRSGRAPGARFRQLRLARFLHHPCHSDRGRPAAGRTRHAGTAGCSCDQRNHGAPVLAGTQSPWRTVQCRWSSRAVSRSGRCRGGHDH